jgi:hypothetical protein
MRVGPLSGQATTAIGTTINERPTAMSHKTKRQRGEGGRPVGKSRSMRGKVIMPGGEHPGKEPREECSTRPRSGVGD